MTRSAPPTTAERTSLPAPSETSIWPETSAVSACVLWMYCTSALIPLSAKIPASDARYAQRNAPLVVGVAALMAKGAGLGVAEAAAAGAAVAETEGDGAADPPQATAMVAPRSAAARSRRIA